MEHETHVTVKQAKILKSLGFDWKCDHFYFKIGDTPERCLPSDDWNASTDERFCSCPALHIVQKWLREKRGVDIVVNP